jgi:hypothetical protein
MGGLLKKTEEKLKKAGHKVEDSASKAGHKVVDGSKAAGHKVVDVSADAGHKTVDGVKAAGHKTVEVTEKAAGRMDFLCDNCGKTMKPGGHFTRVIQGKEHQFCSAQCSNHFHPPMMEP